jgi:zinc/manganese transport system substrate-binding protein
LRPILNYAREAAMASLGTHLARRAIVALAVLGLAACGTPGQTSSSSAPGAIPVLGTENFYADMLAQIGGSYVNVSSILNDPSADPHEYEASTATAKLVADSKIVIVNGIGYDDFMERLLGASNKPDRVVINVQDLLGAKDDVNVHVWYDPATMPKVAEAAAAALARLDPANASYFADHKAKYLASLKPLDDKVAALKSKYSGTPVAFTENVAGYLTDAIGLTVLTPTEFMEAIESGTDPAPADVAAERDLITNHRVKALLYNSQVTSPLTEQIRALAVSSGVPVVPVAETIPPAFKTFQDWQLAQLDDLEKALAK